MTLAQGTVNPLSPQCAVIATREAIMRTNDPKLSTPQERRAVRVSPSGLVSKTAKIFAEQKGSPVIDCYVIDLSPGGACLELTRDAEIPPRFVLLHGGVKKKGRLAWKKGYRFAMVF
jgi:hypothetical protein